MTRAITTGETDGPDPFLLAGPAVRPPSATVIAGRWLSATDDRTVVANHAWSRAHPRYAPGDTVGLRIGDDTTRWVLAGIVREVMAGPALYAPGAAVALAVRDRSFATQAQITARAHDPQSVAFLRAAIERRLERDGIRVTNLITLSDIAQSREGHQAVIVTALLVMAGLSLIVGGLGLASMLSVGIFERSHEIGVMRALGASRAQLLLLVLVEGGWIAVAGWIGSLILSIPATFVLDDVFGRTMLATPLDVAFSGVAISRSPPWPPRSRPSRADCRRGARPGSSRASCSLRLEPSRG